MAFLGGGEDHKNFGKNFGNLANFCYPAVMFNFLQGRLLPVRLILLAATFALVAIGIANIYALGHPLEQGPANQTNELGNKWEKQVQYAVIGFLAFIAINMISYRRLGAASAGYMRQPCCSLQFCS